MPSVFIIKASDIVATDTNGDPTTLGSTAAGSGFHLGGLNISLTATFTEVAITDTGGRPDILEDSTSNQTLTDPITIDGVFYDAGTPVEAEFQITLMDNDGNTYKAWALEIEDGDSNSFENVVGLMFQAGAVPPFDEDLTVTGFLDLFNLSSDNTQEFTYSEGVTCFTSGTLIRMEHGDVPIEDVKTGMRVVTADNGPVEVLWAGSSSLDHHDLALRPDLKPYIVQDGCFGNQRALKVSPQHRLLLPYNDRFVSAKKCAAADAHRVRFARNCRRVTYHHILCETHQVVFTEGMCSETLFPGQQALLAMSQDKRREVFSLFPELRQVITAPSRRSARDVVTQVYGDLARLEAAVA